MFTTPIWFNSAFVLAAGGHHAVLALRHEKIRYRVETVVCGELLDRDAIRVFE